MPDAPIPPPPVPDMPVPPPPVPNVPVPEVRVLPDNDAVRDAPLIEVGFRSRYREHIWNNGDQNSARLFVF